MKRWLVASYRLRIIFRGVFLLLALATLALALSLLQQEKQLSYNSYQSNFNKTVSQISATLRHPAGQLALLNPPLNQDTASLHPLLLPFSALDFDDQSKVQQAIAMSGCLVQYGNDGSLCVGIGNNPWAGGFIYVAGSFNSPSLVSHVRGQVLDQQAHRIKVSVALRGQHYQWFAPFEEETGVRSNGLIGIKGRWLGFWESDIGKQNGRPVRDFRGWAWQKSVCNDAKLDGKDLNCERNTFFSLRLPIAVLQEALFEKKRPIWPPQDLEQIQVELTVLGPDSETPLLDSKSVPSATPFSLNDLNALLLPGESLILRKSSEKREVIRLLGKVEQEEESWNLLTRLIRRLPVDEFSSPLEAKELISTPLDNYELEMRGDVRSVSKSLSVVATRVSWFVGAMLLALLLAWLLIEISIIRRISLLTKRAAELSRTMKGAGELDQLDVSDLRSPDELGVLASGLHDLLRRVKEDVERETIRTEQEKQMWHAVGHEIMSPLQSLMVLHPSADDQSHRYINRMQQAIKVLYGHATPSEAFQSTVLQIGELDLNLFLRYVAENAPHAGIVDVEYEHQYRPIVVKADEYSLEDVVTHILKNADRYRPHGTAIRISVEVSEANVAIHIHNRGPAIENDMLDKIFEYGVSDQRLEATDEHRGQGLFVAQTYMAKMGGTIIARNCIDGVEFVLSLPRPI
ncbi:HAMP domain-containing sensor histidine kinase [Undibacterium cyanobacteriorum]|uniref:histidine kinase n=1 Tax=Undibacterium cyanobacteriorum TaxID=3073561 RepID=A0ABY9RLW4_9BURK|nr:HAMP domain-containing sensor histidine kinase [Undibacterium sp. 20NA77.5]WMW82205.1 HAMP domain-containing sensor histidine kinase [Undibacterium sp. 20NA77.5]